MILLCCSFAPSFFTFRKPLSVSVNSWNSKTYTISRALLVAPVAVTDTIHMLNHFYLVPSPPDLSRCRFYETLPVATASSCYFLRENWQIRTSLFLGFYVAFMLLYRWLQMEGWAATLGFVIPLQPAPLMWPCVSATRPSVFSSCASRAILHSRHLADCILPILVIWLAIGVFPAIAIAKRLLRFHGIKFVCHSTCDTFQA